jgi:hypothetical protein
MHDDSCELCGVAREAKLREAGRNVKLLTNIRQDGYHKVGVFSDTPDTPDYAYTIGMFHTYKHPELVVFGLEIETEFAILDTVKDLVAAGTTFIDGDQSTDVLEGLSVRFLRFSNEKYDEYLGQAENFYRSNSYPVLVVTWPDGSGNFPWESQSPDWLLQRQPRVWSDIPSE